VRSTNGSNIAEDTFLDKRAEVRSASFRVSSFGAENYTSSRDTEYDARDRVVSSERGSRAYQAAVMVSREPIAPHSPLLDLKATLMTVGFNTNTVKGMNADFEIASLRFDTKWLQEVKTILAEDWCSIHHHLSVSAKDLRKYDITMWLSMMVFATSANMDIVQAFVMMHRLRDMATVQVPPFSQVNLFRGDKWDAVQLRTRIGDVATKTISLCPERLIERGYRETKARHARRAAVAYNKSQTAAIQEFVANLQVQWPNQNPSTPSSTLIDTYLYKSLAIEYSLNCYETWRENRVFFKYLDDLSSLLRRQDFVAISPQPLVLVKPIMGIKLSNSARYIGIATMFAGSAPLMFAGGGLFIPEEGIEICATPNMED
jgi:hypothetical protein